MTRKLFIGVAILLQLGVLLWMAAQREWILANGEIIHLRTAPLDPRDLFRGDYVELDYDISVLGPEKLAYDLLEGERRPGERVYVTLHTGPEGLAEAVQASRAKPEQGRYLRGRIAKDWRLQNLGALRVKYGIEKYFVEQGKGHAMEERRGRRNALQTPMEMELALGDSGVAVIRSHRWSRLGIGIRQLPERPAQLDAPADDAPAVDGLTDASTPSATEPASTPSEVATTQSGVFELTLANTSDRPLALALLPDDCSFRIATVKWAPEAITLRNGDCNEPNPQEARIVALKPGGEHRTLFDFRQDERWFVEHEGKRVAIGELPWGYRFRIHYEPPRISGQDADVWQGNLPSAAFHGGGQID